MEQNWFCTSLAGHAHHAWVNSMLQQQVAAHAMPHTPHKEKSSLTQIPKTKNKENKFEPLCMSQLCSFLLAVAAVIAAGLLHVC